MLVSEHGEFQTVMRKLAMVFDRAINAELMEAYWNALRDMPLPVLRARAEGHVRTGKFFPKPRELRDNPDHDRQANDTRSPDVAGMDDWTATLNRMTRDVLMGVQGTSDAALAAMVRHKNAVARQMRETPPTRDEWAEMAPLVVAELTRLARQKDTA